MEGLPDSTAGWGSGIRGRCIPGAGLFSISRSDIPNPAARGGFLLGTRGGAASSSFVGHSKFSLKFEFLESRNGYSLRGFLLG